MLQLGFEEQLDAVAKVETLSSILSKEFKRIHKSP